MRSIIFLLILLFARQLTAQIPITNLSIDQGLSNNSVNFVYQDHYGFMWFGTDDGLNRYDGYGFKTYRNNIKDPNSLVHNRVVSLAEDRSGRLWVGTKQGLSLYDPYTSKFTTSSYLSKASMRKETVSSMVNTINVDDRGYVFVGTYHSGLLVKQDSEGLKQVELKGFAGQSYSVTSIAFQPGKAWIVVVDKGLFSYDYNTGQLELKSANIKRANCMLADRSHLWIGSDSGLCKYDIKTGKHKFYSKENGTLSAARVMSVALEGAKEVWVATDGGGVNIIDLQTDKIRSIQSRAEKNTLTSNAVMSIYKDKEKRTWLGTLRGGVNIIDGKDNKFSSVSHNPLDRNSLISDFVLSFYEDVNGDIWIGTDGGGISIWNRNTKKFNSITHRPGVRNWLSNNNITSIVRDDDNAIWISTFGGGINKYDSKTKTFTRYPCISQNREDKNVWKLFKDSKNNIWAGTCFGSDLTYKLNREKQRFEPYDPKLKYVIAFGEDKARNLWFGTEYGQLVKIDDKERNHKYYDLKHQVRAIHTDKTGNLWIGVQYTGLFRFNPEKASFTSFSESDGLCNNSVLNIQEDGSGNLWLSTFNGISKFNYAKQKFTNYYEKDGLQSNQFSFNASFKLQSGELLFGGIKGFNIFSPEKIKIVDKPAKVLITGIRINNIPIEHDRSFKSEKSVYTIRELTLPYDKAVISVDFASLDYFGANNISYTYFLEGWDKIWNEAGQSRTANYSRLSEGEYLLRIKAKDAQGGFTGPESVLKLIVLPPWYRSWWAYSLFGILIAAAVYCYNSYRTRQAQLRYEVQIANINTEKERELNEKKISFFTNIAHEFRTPLTLISNPIKELIYSKEKSINVSDLSGVFKNSRRLLSLVDQLLLFARADSEVDKLKIVKFNLFQLCQEVYLCYVNEASLKKIDFTFSCTNEDVNIYADKEKIEIAVFNLLSNAFKFTPKGGKILFTIVESEEDLQIVIRDTGKGIPPEIGEKLFEKFYQVSRVDNSFKSGFGIGLYLVKKFVNSHKGEVTFTSTPGEGTEFKIKLLKGKEYLGNIYIFENIPESPLVIENLFEDALLEAPSAEEVAPGKKADIDFILSEQLTLLIIDDNADIRAYIKKVFAPLYNIIEASNGLEGLQLAQKYFPDLVISDLYMTGLNGIELCQKIKEDPAMNHIPVVLLTSATDSELKLKGIECGAADYITKPFDTQILSARVLNILKSRNNLQQYFYNHITLQSDNLKISPEHKDFFNKCISIIEEHLQDPTFTAKSFSKEVGMSYSNLYKKIKFISGKSINEFIRFIRLRKAAQLLITTDYNINQAAFECGFNDIKYFREQFNKLFEVNPSEYLKKYRKSFHESYRLNDKAIEVLEK